jgi:hypothetical protein
MSSDDEIDMEALQEMINPSKSSKNKDSKSKTAAPKRKRLTKIKQKSSKRSSLVDLEAEEEEEVGDDDEDEEEEEDEHADQDGDDDAQQAEDEESAPIRKKKRRRLVEEEEEDNGDEDNGEEGEEEGDDDEEIEDEPNEADLAFIDDSGVVETEDSEEHSALLEQRRQLEDRQKEDALESMLVNNKENRLVEAIKKAAEKDKAVKQAARKPLKDLTEVVKPAPTAKTSTPDVQLPVSSQKKPIRMSENKSGDPITLGFRVRIGESVWRCTFVGKTIDFERTVNANALKLTPSCMYTFYNETEPRVKIGGKEGHHFDVFYVSTNPRASPVKVSKGNMDSMRKNLLALQDEGDGVETYKQWCKQMLIMNNVVHDPEKRTYRMLATNICYLDLCSKYVKAKTAEQKPSSSKSTSTKSSSSASTSTAKAAGAAPILPVSTPINLPKFLSDEATMEAIFMPPIEEMLQRFEPKVLERIFSSINNRLNGCVMQGKSSSSKTAALDEAVKMIGKQVADACVLIALTPPSFVQKVQNRVLQRLKTPSTELASTAKSSQPTPPTQSAPAAVSKPTQPATVGNAPTAPTQPATVAQVAPVVPPSVPVPVPAKIVTSVPVITATAVKPVAPPPPSMKEKPKTWTCHQCGSQDNPAKSDTCVLCGSESNSSASAAATICDIASSAAKDALPDNFPVVEEPNNEVQDTTPVHAVTETTPAPSGADEAISVD